MVDWKLFHATAVAIVPNEALGPKRYWIGVLKHGKTLSNFGDGDILWMKAHAKIPYSMVVSSYQDRNPNVDVEIRFQDQMVSPSTVMKDLNEYSDNVVIFHASEKSLRTPLQPVQRQLVAEPQLPSTPTAAKPPITPSQPAPEPLPAETRVSYSLNVPSRSTPPLPHLLRQGHTEPRNLQHQPATPRERFTSAPPLATHNPPVTSPTLAGQEFAVEPLRQVAGIGGGPTLPRAAQNDGLLSLDASSTSRYTSTQNTPSPFPPAPYHSLAFGGSFEPVDTNRTLLESQQAFPNRYPGHYGHVSPYIHEPPSRPPYKGTPPTSGSNPMPTVDGPGSVIKSEQIPAGPVGESQSNFDVGAVFDREMSLDAEEQVQARPTDDNLRRLVNHQQVEVLEAGVTRALKVLETLQSSFAPYVGSSPDAGMWIQAIAKLATQAEPKRTVVGVVGNTGAGKSSVINAMLDEERLVPTNCMRACTAVVTEISWNYNSEPSSKYRAEIEFIAAADWEKELHALMKEFLTDSGTLSKEALDQGTDAGVAWAKFHAVYPKVGKDMLGDCEVPGLMTEKSVQNVLGTTAKINKANPEPFYRELQKYVDSKEKSTGKDKDKEKNRLIQSMEYWPLIKVVRIYVRAPALSTGAVIVDLPGVHDSNQARAAVAAGYMKQCTGLWIVAPITRAVDDKAAKTLLGDSFKRQLKYDGGFSNITFICSKTDDISITEAMDSLELEDEISALDDGERDCKRIIEDLQSKIDDLIESKRVYKLAIDGADGDLETWEGLLDKLDEGKTVHAPVQNKNKRKRGKAEMKAQKSKRTKAADSDDDFLDSDASSAEADTDSEPDSDDEVVLAPQTPLTEEDIKAKIEELKSIKKNARRERTQIIRDIEDLRKAIREAKAKIKDIRAEMSRICIAGRNEYSRGAIQQDFAAGIKELDQENAEEEDEDAFNPDEDIRDYDEVARSLPVFCVSSRAYQKMSGRLQKDDDVPGFKTPEETEIPQLQAHCKKLTEAGRMQTARTFLLNMCQQLATFYMWASNDGTGLKLSVDEKRAEFKYLDKRLKELDKGLEGAVEASIKLVKREICQQIFEKYPEAIEDAINLAPGTVHRWGAPKADGGLVWSTYKAVVRRDGVYTSASAGPRDFNAELIDPITKRLANSWERAFQNRLPKTLQNYTHDASKILYEFHSRIEERAQQNGVGLANLHLLKNQIVTWEGVLNTFGIELVNSMNELQREANREFTPTIIHLMQTAYEACSGEHGPGSFKRMKAFMENHVDRERFRMFNEATQTVQKHLNDMCKTLENKMAERADEIFESMRRDYMNIIGGAHINQDEVMPKTERVMRAEILSILLKIDDQFRAIADGELEDESQGDQEQSADDPNTGTLEAIESDNDDTMTELRDDNQDNESTPNDTVLAKPAATNDVSESRRTLTPRKSRSVSQPRTPSSSIPLRLNTPESRASKLGFQSHGRRDQ